MSMPLPLLLLLLSLLLLEEYYYHHHPFFSLGSFYCCTWHSRATPSLPLFSKGSKWT